MATSWGTRKSLGRRYGVDPALLEEYENLRQKYALIPGQESRALQERSLGINESQYARSMAYNEEQAELNRAASSKSGMVNTVGTLGGTAAMMYYFKPPPVPPPVPPAAPVAGTAAGGAATGMGVSGAGMTQLSAYGAGGAGAASGTMGSSVGAGASSGMAGQAFTVKPALMMGEGAGIGAAGTGAATTATAGTAPVAAGSTTGGTAAGASGLAYAAPAAGGFVAGNVLGEWTGDRLVPFGGTREKRAIGGALAGAAAGAATGAALTSWSGPGAVVGAVIGAVAGAVGGSCIIITACTDKDSPEVEIAREYRDKYMTEEQLRGYYMIAEKIVPVIGKYGSVKRFTYKHLVKNLIEYGKHKLGKTELPPSQKSVFITRTFLGMCGLLGMTKRQFVRCNGEVY
jgi:hypothetical protein